MHHSKPVKAWLEGNKEGRMFLFTQLQSGIKSRRATKLRFEAGYRF